MKTAEDILLYLIPSAQDLMTPRQYINALGAIKGYAKQTIIKDRENVAKLAETKCLNAPESTCSECEYHIVNKHSIINAPQIELL